MFRLPHTSDTISPSHKGDSWKVPDRSLKKNGTSPDRDLQSIRTGIINWLDTMKGLKVNDNANTLAIGVQSDTNSCGICVLNGIEHAIFGHDLFTHATRYEHRLRYFLAAFRYNSNQVGG